MARVAVEEGSYRRRIPTIGWASCRAVAERVPGGIIDASVGTPVDPTPEVVLAAARSALGEATGYPADDRHAPAPRGRGGWLARRFGVAIDRRRDRRLHRHEGGGRGPPASARAPASGPRHRAVPGAVVPDVRHGRDARGSASRARPGGRRLAPRPRLRSTRPTPRVRSCSGCNDPGEPHRCHGDGLRARRVGRMGTRARDHRRERRVLRRVHLRRVAVRPPRRSRPSPGHTTACSRCTRSRSARTWRASASGSSPATPTLVQYLGEVRKHAGLMIAGAGAGRVRSRRSATTRTSTSSGRATRARRARCSPALDAFGLVHDGGPSTFYLWLAQQGRDETAGRSRRGWPRPVCSSRQATSTVRRVIGTVRLALTLDRRPGRAGRRAARRCGRGGGV